MNLKKEISRDLMAFGGLPFLVLVLVRVWMVNNYLELSQMIFGVGLLSLLGFAFRNGIDQHSGRIIILVVFTSLFYYDLKYSIFASLIGLLAVYGMWRYLERKGVLFGVVFGGVVSLVSYFVIRYLEIRNY